MDVLMVFAWIVFITMNVALLAILGFLAALPGRVARQREHPYADAIALRPGSRVVAAPLAPAMTFLDTNELLISNAK